MNILPNFPALFSLYDVTAFCAALLSDVHDCCWFGASPFNLPYDLDTCKSVVMEARWVWSCADDFCRMTTGWLSPGGAIWGALVLNADWVRRVG